MNTSTIPHESIYHVRVSKALGYDVIEANVHSTIDGVFIVNHLSHGNFGQYFHHVDNQTDISEVAVAYVTWQWIEENVRYNSQIEKYQTRPCRLEEFLGECRTQGLIPFIDVIDPRVTEIVEKYMGGGYIAYNARRADCPNGIIYHWVSKPNKEEIVAYCESIGKPFIYGMANPKDFSEEELIDIVGELHKRGYYIGVSYDDNNWYKYAYYGFDFNGTQTRVNRIKEGNLCNYNSIFNFDNFE